MGVRPHIPAEGRRLYSSVAQFQRVLQRAPQNTENPEPTAAARQLLIDISKLSYMRYGYSNFCLFYLSFY